MRRALRNKHNITEDIRRNLIRWAGRTDRPSRLTTKQADLLLRLVEQAREKASRPVEVLVPAPVGSGRVEIEGVVVSCKSHESDFGETFKMTIKVQTDSGVWLAWGTAPASLLEEGATMGGLVGCKVRMSAALKAGREPHFALFSRPTRAVVVELGDKQRKAKEEQ